MTLGEKIKLLRTKKGFTQELLAEKLNVSRSAIAKWETDSGVPDISNLKLIAQIFTISIDKLLGDASRIESKTLADIVEKCDCSEYAGYYYDIEMNGWNDGVYNVLIIGEDKDFIFYRKYIKERYIHGLLGKLYITSLSKTKKCKNSSDTAEFEGRKYFYRKHVFVELVKEGLIKGFLDFRDDDYRDVVVDDFSESKICFKFGKEIDTIKISRVEEIDAGNTDSSLQEQMDGNNKSKFIKETNYEDTTN